MYSNIVVFRIIYSIFYLYALRVFKDGALVRNIEGTKATSVTRLMYSYLRFQIRKCITF